MEDLLPYNHDDTLINSLAILVSRILVNRIPFLNYFSRCDYLAHASQILQ